MSKPSTYTAQYLGKWHAGFKIGNQSFVLSAFEGTEEEAKWYAEMMNKAFDKLRVVGVCKVRLEDYDPDFPTFPVCSCNGRGPVSPDQVWCPYCGNKTEWEA